MSKVQEQAPPTADEGGLGPSVTPEFLSLPGVQELLGGGGGVARGSRTQTTRGNGEQSPTPSTGAPPAETRAVIHPEIFAKSWEQVDATVSALMQIEKASPEYMRQVADSWLPLANYYASQQAGVTTLWAVAILSLVGYGAMKWQQASLRKEQSDHGRQDQEGAGQGRTEDQA